MYDFRDLGSYLIMLAVLPFFLVVFAMAVVIVAPFYASAWLYHQVRR